MSSPVTVIKNMPQDIFLAIFHYLSAEDILIARQACRAFYDASRSKQLWLVILERDVILKGIVTPSYCRPVDLLSAQQLETLVVHSLRLRQTLLSQSEGPSPSVTPFPQAQSVTWVKLIEGQYILAACSDQNTSALRLWSLRSCSASRCTVDLLAEAYLDGPVVTGLVDTQEQGVIVALEIRAEWHAIIEIVSLATAKDGRPSFARIKRFEEGVSHIRVLSGSLVGFALHQERNIPSILNWRTGEVLNLLDSPDVSGGAVAMAIRGCVVAVVMPWQLRLLVLNISAEGSMTAEQTRSIPLKCSVGWAQTLFSEPERLHLCICGQDGLFTYSVPVGESRSGGQTEDLLPLWHMQRYTALQMELYRRQDWASYFPQFGAHGTTIIWLQRALHSTKHIGFATLPEGLSDARFAGGNSHSPHVYELEHPELPAMYAAGVYDYDEALGVAVFGNAFGELALFNLSALSLARLQGCFEPLLLLPKDTGYEFLPTSTIPSTASLPFPYSGPRVPSEQYAEILFTRWRAQQPDPMPPGWEREGVPENTFEGRTFPLEWTNIVPRVPVDVEDIGWDVEHVFHYFGTIMPLMKDPYVSVFSVGGLLLLWFDDAYELRVVSPEVTLAQFIQSARDHTIFNLPTLSCERDEAARLAGCWLYEMWMWESGELGRNRWLELKERGGEVHSDWLSRTEE